MVERVWKCGRGVALYPVSSVSVRPRSARAVAYCVPVCSNLLFSKNKLKLKHTPDHPAFQRPGLHAGLPHAMACMPA